MHSKIIQVSTGPIRKDAWLDPDDAITDETIGYVADYTDSCSEEERKETLEGLAELLDGIATVDVEKGIITVNEDREASVRLVNDWHQKTLKALLRTFSTEKCPDPLTSIFAVEKYRGSSFLFYAEYGRLSSAFVHDLALGYYGKTLHIRAVLDYHY